MSGDDGDGAGGEPESAANAATDGANAPPQVLELAEACVRFVSARYGVPLDFDPDTLSLLDQWLRDARGEIVRAPETAELVQAAAGAYLGEVIRRQFGGTWRVPPGPQTPSAPTDRVESPGWPEWRLQLAPVYCAFNPIGMAREALFLEPQEGWHAHFELDPAESEAVEARLAALPHVEEDDYYAPSTRYDVVCIVVDALRDGLRSLGMGDVMFAPEDYVTSSAHRGQTNGKL